MSVDNHFNFGISRVQLAPSPANSGTSLTVVDATPFGTPPFNCTVWPKNTDPFYFNAEIVRVIAIVGNVFTIQRSQEGSSARSILITDNIAATITAKTLTDAEEAWGKKIKFDISSDSTYEIPAGYVLDKIRMKPTAADTVAVELTVGGGEIMFPTQLTPDVWISVTKEVVADDDGTIVYFVGVTAPMTVIIYIQEL